MALTPDRNYATRHDPVEHTVAKLLGPVVAHVRAHPGQTVPDICAVFPTVPLRTMYRVLSAAARRHLLRKDRLNDGTRGFCVQPYHAPAPPRTVQWSDKTITKDGWTPPTWVHPIRARTLGLTPPPTPTHPLLDPDFSHPMKGAA